MYQLNVIFMRIKPSQVAIILRISDHNTDSNGFAKTFELPKVFGQRAVVRLRPHRHLHISVFGTMDPFEVRMQFISNLKKLNA